MRNYVVIGGSSGIGKELVRILAEQGDRIFATYHHTSSEESFENLTFQKFDVLNDTLDQSDFPEALHGFVYCPGSINLKSFHRFKEEDFLEDYRLQVLGATKLIQQLLPALKKADEASIVLFSTVAVQTGFNFHSQVAASKGAIEGLTRALAAEFAPKIRVNAIAPSLTDTPLAGKLLGNSRKSGGPVKAKSHEKNWKSSRHCHSRSLPPISKIFMDHRTNFKGGWGILHLKIESENFNL